MMQIPSFDVFLDSVEPDYMARVASDAIKNHADGENADMSTVMLASYEVTVALLARYHAWLCRQIDAPSHDA